VDALVVLQKFGRAFSLSALQEGGFRVGLHGERQNVDADKGPKLVL